MSSDEGVILGLLAVFAGFIFLFVIVGIVLYVLYAIGMFKITKREGREDLAWLAWIPLANMFLMPMLIENDVHQELRGKFTMVYGIVFVGTFLLNFVISGFSFIFLIVALYAFYIFSKRYSDNSVIH